ncbi:MAG: flagellar basal-body rod protein FlgC [Cellulomonas sp.]|jgi:flagellar basal-body rod protein FlgC|uniref:flagellar basal body rod protein FlgC n=1 Tax=Cellulomonas sp. TaxID=40001 RepID=UPI0019EBE76C|nr:flagellar basal body rod C-terminal domain-containing protein [Cellulomonas sp.]MBF0689191.1 flagellar basal-body rod protein FlgC [Cellulomonas sp.]
MTIFGAIGVAGTGMTVTRKWLDAISDNIANASTVTPTSEEAFRSRFVLVEPMTGGDGGVQVAGIALGSAEGRLVHEPGHPLADEDGYVRYPDVDMASQMTQLIMAQRGYQANAATVSRVTESYQAALQIGRNQ